jgi:outer membrane protein assembly factor BamB
LTAGVGSDGRFSAVVTRDNEVVTFEGAQVRWRQRVPARVVTAPLVAGERVFVLAVDRTVHAFDALDGRRLWTFQRPGDALTLAQAGVLTGARNQLLVGQAGRLVALDPLRGTIVWDLPLATPRGSNEVERLADLVGPAVRAGTASVRVRSRTPWAASTWPSRPCCGRATMPARRRRWHRRPGVRGRCQRPPHGLEPGQRRRGLDQRTLLYRGLSGALAIGPSVVFGDIEGQVHFLSAADGSSAAASAHRRQAGGRHAGAGGHDAAGDHPCGRAVRLPPQLNRIA